MLLVGQKKSDEIEREIEELETYLNCLMSNKEKTKEEIEKTANSLKEKRGPREKFLFENLEKLKIKFTRKGDFSMTGNECLKMVNGSELLLESLKDDQEYERIIYFY
jgi:hypothetical protein